MTEVRSWRAHLPAGSALLEADLTAAGTLVRAWSSGWASAPEAPALLDGATDSEPIAGHRHRAGTWWSGAELDEATRRVAGRLLGSGLVPGDRLLWSTGSSVATLIVHIAALRAGLVVVPANTAYTAREIGHIVTDVRPVAAVVDDRQRGQWAREAAGGSLTLLGPEVDAPDHDPGPLDVVEPEDPALIVFTSGTTGVPKGAVLSHRNLLASVESVRTAWRWVPDDRLVHCLPVFHAHGLCVGAYGTLLAGASAVLLPGFDPGRMLDAAAEHTATLFFGVPTMYHRLAASDRVGELGRLRLCVSGSAPLGCRSAPARVRGHRAGGARALRDDRDAHERLEPLRRRAPSGNGRVPAARSRGGPGRRRRDPGTRAERLPAGTGNAPRPQRLRSRPIRWVADPGSARATWGR